MAKYLQNSSDIEIEEVTGTENIKFNFANNNSIDTKIGNLSNLQTSDKTNVVSAINDCIDSGNYSTSEIKTNKTWTNNKPIYRKVISCGNLPNASSNTIAHGITSLETYINVTGVAQRISDNDLLPIPYVTFNANNAGGIVVYCDNTNVYLTTTSNRSAYVGYVTLEYTKTTD